MIAMYKIGQDRYAFREDTNGGKFETDLIKSAIRGISLKRTVVDLNKIDYGSKIDLLFLIAGADVNEKEKEKVDTLIYRSERVIFIVTDALFLKDERISKCSEVWAQSDIIIHDISSKQWYSYVPELFFDEFAPQFEKVNTVIFAGNAIGREADIERYIYSNSELADLATVYLKTLVADNRVPYEAYQRLLGVSKYSILFDRKSSSEVNWVTPRVVELINMDTIPLVSQTYDSGCHFIPKDSILRVKDADDIMRLIKHETYPLWQEFENIKHKIRSSQHYFKALALSAIKEAESCLH